MYDCHTKEYNSSLESKIKEIDELNTKIMDLDNEISMLKEKESSLTEENNFWKDKEKKLKEMYRDLHYSLLVVQEENKNYKNKINEYETKCANFLNKIKELQSNLYTLIENSDTEINSSILLPGTFFLLLLLFYFLFYIFFYDINSN